MHKIRHIVSLPIILSLTIVMLVFTSEGWAETARERLWNNRHRLSAGAYNALFAGGGAPVPTAGKTVERLEPLAFQPCTNPPCPDPQDQFINSRSQQGLTQNEPAIAAFGNAVVAGWNDSGVYTGQEISQSGYGYSTNGGLSWTDGGELQKSAGNLIPAGDPWLATNTSGHFFYSTLLVDDLITNTPLSSLGVAKSVDGGQTFARPVEVITPTRDYFFDKPALTVDKTTGLLRSGYIYLTYTRFTSPPLAYRTFIEMVRSADGGQTWSAPFVIQPEDTLTNQGSMPVVGPNGELYVVWEHGWIDFTSPTLLFRKSTDGGQTWGLIKTIATICSIAFTPLPGYTPPDRKPNEFPQIAVDISPGSPRRGWMYVVWNECNRDNPPDPTNPEIYLSRSTNGGDNWSAPVRVNTVTTNRQFFPSITVDAIGNIHSIFYDRSQAPSATSGLTWTFYARSTDGGATFEPSRQLSTQSTDWMAVQSDFGVAKFADYIMIASFGTSIHGAWTDGRNNYPLVPPDPDIFYRKELSPFADNFDDATTGSRFFSNSTTGARWAVAQSVDGALCDLSVRTLGGTPADQVAEVKFSGIGGQPGATYSSASYKLPYTPDNQDQRDFIRITTPDGSDLSNKQGRILTGVIGQTGTTTLTCPTGLTYDRQSVGAYILGGLELDTRIPFIAFNPPYTQVNFLALKSLAGIVKLTIEVKFTGAGVTLTFTNSDTDAQLFQDFTPYPGFIWSGTTEGAFFYYGNFAGTSGTLWVRDFTVHIP